MELGWVADVDLSVSESGVEFRCAAVFEAVVFGRELCVVDAVKGVDCGEK